MKKMQEITPRKLKTMFGVNLLVISERFDFPDPVKVNKNETIILIVPARCQVTFVAHDIFDDMTLLPGFYPLKPKKDHIGTATYTVAASSRRRGRRRLTSHSIKVGS